MKKQGFTFIEILAVLVLVPLALSVFHSPEPPTDEDIERRNEIYKQQLEEQKIYNTYTNNYNHY